MISALGEGIMTIADGPEMPSINDFLPDPFVFQGTPFAINPAGRGDGMKVKDRYWEAENSIRFANPEKTTRPLLCEPKVSEDGVRIRLWLRNLAEGTGAGGAIVLLSRHEAAVMANAINTRSNWIGEKTSDMPRIGVSVTETSTIIRFMECGGAGHIALPLADGERLASCLHDMADGCWRAHCGYVPEAAK